MMDQPSINQSPVATLRRMTCKHCGKSMNVRQPSKPGHYKFSCPHCSQKVSFDVESRNDVAERKVLRSEILDDRVISRSIGKPQDVSNIGPKIIGAESNKNEIPLLGIPVKHKTKENIYVIKKRAIVNKAYRSKCPVCGKGLELMPRVADKFIKTKCSCGAIIVYQAKSETPAGPVAPSLPPVTPPKQPAAQPPLQPMGICPPPPKPKPKPEPPVEGDGQRTIPIKPVNVSGSGTVSLDEPQGALCWKTGTLVRRTKVRGLHKGCNTVGREDKDIKSDIMIDGDDEMSRQSVEINVAQRRGMPDFVYEFNILKATNPIYINGKPVGYGKKVQLNYGDIIRMGKTNISFIKRKNSK